MDVILVVDMQAGLLNGAPKHDLDGVVRRINALTGAVRGRGGKVVWIRHCGRPGDGFAPDTPGWAFLPQLTRDGSDLESRKTLNDPFAGTGLGTVLGGLAPDRLLVAGWATDFCVDATVRSAVSNGYEVVAVGDAHTCSDRPHLEAPAVIRHHNWLWGNLISPRAVRVADTAHLLDG
jgi:nicotinamidase-related amidase